LREIDCAFPICRQEALVYARTRSRKQLHTYIVAKAAHKARLLKSRHISPRSVTRRRFQLPLADFRAGALRLGEGGGSEEAGAGSARRAPPALALAIAVAAAVLVGVDFDSGTDLESGAAVSALAP
jgi:hypothetical protein